MGNDLFDMAVATIFARECMEAMIIIGTSTVNYSQA